MGDPVRVFPVPDRSRRKSKSPTPSKSIAKLFPNDRISSKTPVPERADSRERPTPIPKLKLRSIAPNVLSEMPHSVRELDKKENSKSSLSSVSARGVLSLREEHPLSEVKMIRLQALGDIMAKLLATSKSPEDSLLDMLRNTDSPTHFAGGCALCGCTCKGILSTSTDNVKKLTSAREPNKQTLMVDVSERGSIRECLSCGNKFCDDSESSVRVCSLCQENYILVKQDKLTLQMKIKLEKALAEPTTKKRDVSPRLFRLKTDRMTEFPPRFSTPTKNLFPVQHGPSITKEAQTDPQNIVMQLSLAGQKFNVRLSDTIQSLHFILPDPSPLRDLLPNGGSLPLSEYVNSMSSNLLETQKDLKNLTSKDDQTRLITPKFNGPASAHESTTYTDNSHSLVLRLLTDKLDLIEAEADTAAERLSQCFNSLSSDLEQFAGKTLQRDVERSLEQVLKVSAPMFSKLSHISPKLNDSVLMAFGLVLMITDRLLTMHPHEAKHKTEIDKTLEETRKKMKLLQSGLKECQETYEERLLQLLKLH
mmetsp:Transcript_31464/g.54550  ORF Transcript_31464/g.54550 Transcript_31464/m.54550 type:complete len:535 (+) Transcript_31464:105-1709(+)